MRYFIEVSYKGTNYAGFQIQNNATTIQGEVEKALSTILRQYLGLTGSSRTDAGVHALQNFFHFDLDEAFNPAHIYNLNALLPVDIVIKAIIPVAQDAHSRFIALSRQYKYYITTTKSPFLTDVAWYYPFSVDMTLLGQAARVLYNYMDFTSFSKRNTQVHTKNCTIVKSEWAVEGNSLVYTVKANRFLRGMVRGLVGTMLLVGRKKISLNQFEDIIQARDCAKANFATPPHGLFLVNVDYPATCFQAS
jgi:tRNA pseudouridine38-40 synthase